MDKRHAYILVWSITAAVTLIDGGILQNQIPATPAVHVGAVIVNLLLGVASAAIPAWFNVGDQPLPSVPTLPSIPSVFSKTSDTADDHIRSEETQKQPPTP